MMAGSGFTEHFSGLDSSLLHQWSHVSYNEEYITSPSNSRIARAIIQSMHFMIDKFDRSHSTHRGQLEIAQVAAL